MANGYLEEMFGLSEQVAVVIGGTGVLGGAFCRGLAQAGAKIVVAGRSEERGNERVKELQDLGGAASFQSVDVSSRESIDALLAATLKENGRVDVLVNGAGVNAASSYFEAKDD
ncbi:MAG: SDR family NAD(P)-dependent oxidoreductase, partial [Planctomycetales bacterium]